METNQVETFGANYMGALGDSVVAGMEAAKDTLDNEGYTGDLLAVIGGVAVSFIAVGAVWYVARWVVRAFKRGGK